MRTNAREEKTTFAQKARRAQLVACAIAAIVQVGYAQASIAEVARRAGVSKGVVTYHFAARDDLIGEVIAEIFGSIADFISPRLARSTTANFIPTYIEVWVDYYRLHRQYMFAIAEIWSNYRDPSGRQILNTGTIAPELAGVEHALRQGQADGSLRPFSTRVMAVSLKAALDGLLAQLAMDPEIDLAAYAAEVVELFQRATLADHLTAGQTSITSPASTATPTNVANQGAEV